MELTIINQKRHTIIIPGNPETITIERDAALDGNPIRVTDAAKKYNITQPTLSNWARRGMIRILNHSNHTLELDEGGVALAVTLYGLLCRHVSKQRAGHTLKHLLTA